MCKSPTSPEIPMRGHAHGAVEKRERSEQGLCGKIGQKSVNRKLLHIAQGLCRELGVWKRPSTPLQRRSLSALQAVGLVASRRPHALVGAGHAPPGDAVTTGIGCRQNGKRPRFVIARALCARGNLGKALPIRKGYRQNGTRQLRL